MCVRLPQYDPHLAIAVQARPGKILRSQKREPVAHDQFCVDIGAPEKAHRPAGPAQVLRQSPVVPTQTGRQYDVRGRALAAQRGQDRPIMPISSDSTHTGPG